MWKFPEELSERAFGKLFREAKGALDDLQKDLTSVFSGMPSMSVDTYFDSGLGVDMCAMTDKGGCRRCRVGNGRSSGCATVWGWRPSVTSRAACTSPLGATGSGVRRSRA